ncbi:hypothetical protein KI387_028070, partial [Taxus chinensis]
GFQSKSLPDDTTHIREELHKEDDPAAPSSIVPSSTEIHTKTPEILDTLVDTFSQLSGGNHTAKISVT